MIKQFINKLINSNKADTMKAGKVKFFNKSKGFGFIIIKDSDEEIFVHASNLIDDIKESDNVTFEIEKGDRGLTAIKVKRA